MPDGGTSGEGFRFWNASRPEPAPQASIDLDAILTVHRDQEAYIGFCRKPATPTLDGKGRPQRFQNLFSIRADDLRGMFPAIAGWLIEDSYFTVNGLYRAAPYLSPATGLPGVWRAKKHLRSLTACYVDIDCGRPESAEPGGDLEWREASARAGYMGDIGAIPHPSIIARSGRGAYLLWLLRDETNPDAVPRAWPEKVALYEACNRSLMERMREHELPADRVAIDAARILRVPGSIHRKVNRRVHYLIQADQDGKGFAYTLPQLAEFLGIQTAGGTLPERTRQLAARPTYRKVKNPGSAPLRARGTQNLNAMRAQDLLTLHHHRGGFARREEKHADGTTSPGRRFLLELYTSFLRGARETEASVLSCVREMAESMNPPWPDATEDPSIEALVGCAYRAKPRRWRNVKLCTLLGIDAALARELDLATIRPAEVAIEEDRARPHESEIWARRIEFTRAYIEQRGKPTARMLARVLHSQGLLGSDTNQQTANLVIQAVCPPQARSRGGRPPRRYRPRKPISAP